ncbi:MAG: sugar-binding protein [Phycisphaeraceae bacterium]
MLLLQVAPSVIRAQEAKEAATNLVTNGGFEQGEKGWMWQQWKGKPLPGYIDKDDMHEGLASFKLHQDPREGVDTTLYMGKEARVETGKDYVLTFALKTKDVPQGAARVSVLLDKGGWLGKQSGNVNRVKTGGTQDWRVYTINIPAGAVGEAQKLTIFFYHDKPSAGEVGIDAVSVVAAAAGSLPVNDAAPAKDDAEAAPAEQPKDQPKAAEPAEDKGNLVMNGGFESGEKDWMWNQWKGKPLPGKIDKDDKHSGTASFKMHLDDVEGELHIAAKARLDPRPDPAKPQDYVLTLALKAQDMPANGARVRVLIDPNGQGRWLNRETGKMDVVKTGGTHDWKTYDIRVPASAVKDATEVFIFFYHAKGNEGTLGIDSVSLKPKDGNAAAGAPGSAAPIEGTLESVTYATGNPVVLLAQKDAPVAIGVSPEQALYRTGALPSVTVRAAANVGATLRYRVVDALGQKLGEGSGGAEQAAALNVTLPPGHGYYEIIATLTRGDEVVAEARRSLGALDPPAQPIGDEPFGLWIQGMEHYPELGVRWTREGIYWHYHQTRGESYLQDRRRQLQWYRDHHIRVLAYPKHPHPHQTSREVIQDTPEAWQALEEFWTKMVQELGPLVDAWGVVNEPITGHWKGSDELIIRYWALMRKIVDKHDPGKPLVGPSLGLAPSNVTQYEKLLAMGLGKMIDAVEVHTYITSPEDMDWAGQTRRLAEMTRQATGKDLPIWSSEHGSSGTYDNELLQAQHLMRSWLVAKQAGYPMVIWHMFSMPQGSDLREINFGIFRNGKERGSIPQARPAGVAYGVMTRQLAGATYKTQLDYLGPSVNAFVFERPAGGGKAMIALWTTSQKTYDVTLAVGQETIVTQTGLFGRVEALAVRDGLVRVTVDRNPKFIADLPAFYLESAPIARLDKPIETLPGASVQASLTLVNPTKAPGELRIEWLPADGWRFDSPRSQWTLAAGERKSVPLTATAPAELAIGRYQVYAKVFLNGKYVTALSAQASVLPQVTVTGIEPSFDAGRAVIVGSLRRVDPALYQAIVQLVGDRSEPVTFMFNGKDEVAFAMPVGQPAGDRLEDFTLIVRGSQGREQLRESLRMSFVPAVRVKDARAFVDGALQDVPAARWGWDEKHLYLTVQVQKATHVQNQTVTEMWKDDSVQIGIAADRPEQLVREFLPGLQEAEMVEFDVALRSDGPALYRHRTVNKHLAPVGEVSQEQVRYSVHHAAGVTTYQARFPVEQLGLKPLARGQVLRAAVLINTNEGQGRQTTEWFGGIKESKNPDLFGHLILAE